MMTRGIDDQGRMNDLCVCMRERESERTKPCGSVRCAREKLKGVALVAVEIQRLDFEPRRRFDLIDALVRQLVQARRLAGIVEAQHQQLHRLIRLLQLAQQ